MARIVEKKVSEESNKILLNRLASGMEQGNTPETTDPLVVHLPMETVSNRSSLKAKQDLAMANDNLLPQVDSVTKPFTSSVKSKSASLHINDIGGMMSKVEEAMPDGLLAGPINKLWVARILLNRTKSMISGVEQGSREVPVVIPSPIDTKLNRSILKMKEASAEAYYSSLTPPEDSITKPFYNFRNTKTSIKNEIIIFNRSTNPYTKLVIQGVPNSVEVNPETSWATVKSAGRNNPFYIYTGSEDSVSFEVNWYILDDKKGRIDVIEKCKLLESWTKADGYKASPPALQISWGSSGIYDDDLFILTSAKYTLSQHQNAYRVPGTNSTDVDLRLLPNMAIQSLVFKKVTRDNQTHQDIQYKNTLR